MSWSCTLPVTVLEELDSDVGTPSSGLLRAVSSVQAALACALPGLQVRIFFLNSASFSLWMKLNLLHTPHDCLPSPWHFPFQYVPSLRCTTSVLKYLFSISAMPGALCTPDLHIGRISSASPLVKSMSSSGDNTVRMFRAFLMFSWIVGCNPVW